MTLWLGGGGGSRWQAAPPLTLDRGPPWALSDGRRLFREVLRLFEGRHPFHNYTVQRQQYALPVATPLTRQHSDEEEAGSSSAGGPARQQRPAQATAVADDDGGSSDDEEDASTASTDGDAEGGSGSQQQQSPPPAGGMRVWRQLCGWQQGEVPPAERLGAKMYRQVESFTADAPARLCPGEQSCVVSGGPSSLRALLKRGVGVLESAACARRRCAVRARARDGRVLHAQPDQAHGERTALVVRSAALVAAPVGMREPQGVCCARPPQIGAAVAVANGFLSAELVRASLTAPARLSVRHGGPALRVWGASARIRLTPGACMLRRIASRARQQVPKAPPHTLILSACKFTPFRGVGGEEAAVARFSGAVRVALASSCSHRMARQARAAIPLCMQALRWSCAPKAKRRRPPSCGRCWAPSSTSCCCTRPGRTLPRASPSTTGTSARRRSWWRRTPPGCSSAQAAHHRHRHLHLTHTRCMLHHELHPLACVPRQNATDTQREREASRSVTPSQV